MKAHKDSIVVVDYGVGNMHSVARALLSLGYRVVISRDEDHIRSAAAIVLPGVGAFPEGMKNLHSLRLIDALREAVHVGRTPCLGVCLGMQLLADASDEGGEHAGLGWIPGRVRRLPAAGVRIPHVGWNTLRVVRKEPLFSLSAPDAEYYFDHSYYFECERKNVLASSRYGIAFPAAVGLRNIYGVQFHPEKSQTNGLKLYRSFFTHFGIRPC